MNDETKARESLGKLGDRIEKEREAAGLTPKPSSSTNRALGEGMRVAIEFVVSVFVGAGLGYLIGNLTGHKMIGVVLGLFFGFATGLRTVYRFMNASAAPEGDAQQDEKDRTEDGRDDD